MLDKNIGERIKIIQAVAPYNIVAAGTNDNSEKVGVAFDRTAYKGGRLGISITATLAEAATAIITSVKITQADTLSGSYTDFITEKTNVKTLTGGTGGSTVSGVYEYVLPDLENAKAFIKFAITVNLSAGSVDTANVAAVVILGGARNEPIAV